MSIGSPHDQEHKHLGQSNRLIVALPLSLTPCDHPVEVDSA